MNGMNRRRFLFAVACTALAACTEQDAIVDQGTEQQINIRDVVIDTSALPKRQDGTLRTGRQIPLTEAQLKQDLDRTLTRLASIRQLDGKVPVILKVSMTEVGLVSPGQAFAVGGRSNMEGLVSLTTTRGQVLLEPTTVNGFSSEVRMGGLIGAMTSPSAGTDYQNTVAGFSNNVMRKLFEDTVVGMSGAIVN